MTDSVPDPKPKKRTYKKKLKPGSVDGRPTKYDPKYCKEIVDFFDVPYTTFIELPHYKKGDISWVDKKEVATPIPQVGQFARKIGVHRDTLDEWTRVHPCFSDAYTRAKHMQEEMLVSNATKGLYNSFFTLFVMKNRHNWKDRIELPGDEKIDEALKKYETMDAEELIRTQRRLARRLLRLSRNRSRN